MQVFKIEPTLSYTNGIALVAAKSNTEAISKYCEDEIRAYKYDEYNCTCNIIVGLDFDEAFTTIILDCISEN